eukprot:RCo005952
MYSHPTGHPPAFRTVREDFCTSQWFLFGSTHLQPNLPCASLCVPAGCAVLVKVFFALLSVALYCSLDEKRLTHSPVLSFSRILFPSAVTWIHVPLALVEKSLR